MTAFNIVRFRVKPGHEEHFIAAHRGRNLGLRGFRGGTLVKTGERSYCIVGEWTSLQKLIEARPKMIGILDTFRDDLEDLGAGLGQTDPVSGEVVLKLPGYPSRAGKSREPSRVAQIGSVNSPPFAACPAWRANACRVVPRSRLQSPLS